MMCVNMVLFLNVWREFVFSHNSLISAF